MANPTTNLAVYFGSFDPIHLNHLSLCDDLLKRGFEHVYLVPNPNNDFKPFMVSRNQRLQMIEEAIKGNARLTAYDSPIEQHTWEGRYQICDLIKAKYSSASGTTSQSIKVSIVIGQDSFEKAIQRCRPGQGIHRIGSGQLLVYPRSGYNASITVPVGLKQSVKVMDDYEDPMPRSSSAIREVFLKCGSNTKIEEMLQYLHPMTLKLIQTHQLYYPYQTQRKIIAFLGSPGSGKGTICSELQKQFPHYIHISTGDLYREAESHKTPAYYRVQEEKTKGASQYMDALNIFIIERLKEIINPDQYYLIDGLKPTDLAVFEDKITKIDSIVYLKCSSYCAEQRLKKRRNEGKQARTDDTDASIQKRLGNYFKFLWIQTEILTSYQSTGRTVLTLNADKPVSFLMAHPLWKTLIQRFPPKSKSQA
jgi:adenylate kinase family enzyme/nicotinic acid mononucleotide adenylyltransferase